MKYIVALDQGTTSSRTVVFDTDMNIVAMAQREFRQIYPQPGWVEHDPYDILSTQAETLREAVSKAAIDPGDILCIGITNQRETTLVWNRKTGKPIYNAIVWQCRRTAKICEQLITDGLEDEIRDRTGLVMDAYFSGTKVKWLLDNVAGARALAEKGELAFGTVDSWLLWNLTSQQNHRTDVTNASRTQLFNIHALAWDTDILSWLGIPASMLPEVLPCTADFGLLRHDILGQEIPIRGIAGDQHAALFGQACFERGDAKNTYGTGCFLLMNTGNAPVTSANRLLTAIAWDLGSGPCYALEGSVFMAGAAIQWLRDELGLIRNSAESESVALSVPDSAGVYLVPAFTGLGAPWWDMYARGTIVGLTRGAGRAHIVRAALEAIAYQSHDVLTAMVSDSGLSLNRLKVDGGASSNQFLMQFQADLLGVPVIRPTCVETTAMGAAYFAGLSYGIFQNTDEITRNWNMQREFLPFGDASLTRKQISGWHRAVARAQNWEQIE